MENSSAYAKKVNKPTVVLKSEQFSSLRLTQITPDLISSSLPTPATFIKQVCKSAINPLFESSMLLKLAGEIQTDPSKHHELLHTNTPTDHVFLFYVSVLSRTGQATAHHLHLLRVTAVKNVYHLHTSEEKYLYWKTVFLQVLLSYSNCSQGVTESILWV